VKITQSYINTKKHILRPFSFSNKSITLRIIDKESGLNKRKQIIALMPNLIHSLDAASLALLFNKYFKEGGSKNSIYTIHDCFAVSANNVELLIDTLKTVYIQIYSNNKYLESFDNNIRECIKMHYKDLIFKDDKLYINDNVYNFPNINLVTGKDLNIYPKIKFSSYLIC
jgi:DNA-directed RNA polymerase